MNKLIIAEIIYSLNPRVPKGVNVLPRCFYVDS
jgi:hypothetical protein